MSPDLPGVELGGPAEGLKPVFVVDATADGVAAVHHLRSLGYEVFPVPLQLLVQRVAIQQPSLVVCNADTAGALAAAQQLRALPGRRLVHIIYLGTPGRTLSDDADATFHEGSAFVPLPLSCERLATRMAELIGPPQPRLEGSELARDSLAPSGSASPGRRPSRPSMSAGLSSRRPPASVPSRGVAPSSAGSRPPSVRGPAAAQALPPDEEAPAPPKAAVSSVSPSLARLLEDAEARISVRPLSAHPSSDAPARLSPEQEIDAVLSEELLAALDEPLLDDDEDDDSQDEGSATGRSGSSGTGSSNTSTGTASSTGTGSSEATSETAARRTQSGPQPEPSPAHVDVQASAQDRRTTAPPADPRLRAPGRPNPSPPPSRPDDPSHGFDDEPSTPRPRMGLPRRDAPHSMSRASSSIPPPSSWEGRTGRLPVPHSPGPPSAREPESSISEPPTPTPRTPPLRPPALHARGQIRDSSESRTSTSQPPVPTPVQGLGRHFSRPPPPPGSDPPATPRIPSSLGPGEVLRAMGRSIRSRFTGALALEDGAGIRRVVFREGDFVTVASGVDQESLVAFLVERGDLPVDAARLARTLPQFGRHAGAALIAHGYLRQDELWTALRAHAEWLLGHALGMDPCGASIEKHLAARLQAEPSVFGGATGAEILLEVARRVVGPDQAIVRLHGPDARLRRGPSWELLAECGLGDRELDTVLQAPGFTVAELIARVGAPDFAPALEVLVTLGILQSERSHAERQRDAEPKVDDDSLDDSAVRTRVRLRRALVDQGDYFTLLGVSRQATGYEIRRAYLQLRREFSPGSLLTARTVELREDVEVILEVLEEAYEILKDETRRRRYRRALESAGG